MNKYFILVYLSYDPYDPMHYFLRKKAKVPLYEGHTCPSDI